MIIMLLTISASCKRSPEKIETEQLTEAIDQIKVNKNYQWIVVLPGLGCHGCIQEGEVFMRDHIKNGNILFVLTKISSLKILQQKIGIKLTEHPNVYIDREDDFTIPTDNSIYPCIIKMEKGQMVNHEFQSPKNGGAFAKLNSLVSAQ